MATEAQSHYLLRTRRLCCTGSGVDLQPENACFAHELGRVLGAEKELVTVTGGFKYRQDDVRAGKMGSYGVDWHVAQGVLETVRQEETTPSNRLWTMLPSTRFDDPLSERFHEGRIITMESSTPQARRFRMVNECDVVTTIQGRKGAGEIIDLAIAMERPVLPLPFTGGVSRDRWDLYRDQIMTSFGISEAMGSEWERKLVEGDMERAADLAAQVRSAVLSRMKHKCFIIMPFKKAFDAVYRDAIEPAVQERGLAAVRSDKLALTGNIMHMVRSGIDSCDCVICDLTGYRPNVMYELGLAHARDKPVVLLCERSREAGELGDLPFDIGNEAVIGYDRTDQGMRELRGLIVRALAELYTS